MLPRVKVAEHAITSSDAQKVVRITREILGPETAIPLATAMDAALILCDELPRNVRDVVRRSYYTESAHVVLLRIDPGILPSLPPVPSSHRQAGEAESADAWDIVHLLFAYLRGYPFTWSTIQNGYLFNDVIPVDGFEEEASSRSSSVDFGLHTEDAFSPHAGSTLVLQCRVNTARASTTLATYDPSALGALELNELFDAEYRIGANIAHSNTGGPAKQPIFYGSFERPYFRLNTCVPLEATARRLEALDRFVEHLEESVLHIELRPGDHLLIDNQRVAHGRTRFANHHRNAARWLRRLYVTTDIRTSRSLRDQATSWINSL